jgi:hypothetical protein
MNPEKCSLGIKFVSFFYTTSVRNIFRSNEYLTSFPRDVLRIPCRSSYKAFVFFFCLKLNYKFHWNSTVPDFTKVDLVKNFIFCDTMPCIPLKVNRRFGGICCLHLRIWRICQGSKLREAGSKQSRRTVLRPLRVDTHGEGNFRDLRVFIANAAEGEGEMNKEMESNK